MALGGSSAGGSTMRAGHGWLRDLLVTLAGALVLAACDSPEDAGHRVFGYVDADGREVIAPQYLVALPFHEGLAAVMVAEGWGYIDTTGGWVVRPQYQAAASFSNGRAAVRDAGGAWGYIDRSGRMVIAARYRHAGAFIDGRAFVGLDDGGLQVIDRDGLVAGATTATDPVPSDAYEDEPPRSFWLLDIQRLVDEWMAAIQAERLIPMGGADEEGGYVDPEGKPVTEFAFEDMCAFVDGRARVSRDDKQGFIDRAGRFVVTPKYDDALLRFSRDRTVAVHDGQAWLIDALGRDIASLGAWPWPNLSGDEGFGDLARFLGYGDFFADGLIPWQRDDQWGYVGLDGSWVIPPQYQMAQPFHDGRASVQADGRGLLIDVQGREVARVPRGWWIAPSGGSRLRAGTATRWGFAGADGKPPAVLPYATVRINFMHQSFAEARPLHFSEGLAIVSRIAPHRWQVVDANGRQRGAGRFDWVEDAGEGFYTVAIDQRWALTDGKLGLLSTARFDESFLFFGPRDPGSTVAQDGREGCVDRRGRWRALPAGVAYADCATPLMVAHTGSLETHGVLASDGHWVIPPQYEHVGRLEDPGAACFELRVTKTGDAAVGRIACVVNGEARYSEPRQYRCALGQVCFLRGATGWQRLDFRSLQVIGPTYAEIGHSWQGQVAVRLGERWGLLGVSGRMTLPAEYDEVAWLNDPAGAWRAALMVRQGDRRGVVASDGGEILPVRYAAVVRLSDELYAVREASAWGVVRDGGEVVVAPRFEEILTLCGDLLLVRSAGTLHLETLAGQPVLDPVPPWLQRIHRLSDFSAGFWAAFTLDRELYFINKQTRAVHRVDPPPGLVWLAPHYIPRLQDEVAGFKTGGFSGFLHVRPPGETPDMNDVQINAVVVDAEGRRLPWLFDGVVSSVYLPDHHYVVHLRGKCGVIDGRGRWTVPLTHDHCEDIAGGLIIVGDEDY